MVTSIILMIALSSAYFISGYQVVPLMVSALASGLLAAAALTALLLKRRPQAKTLFLQALAFGLFCGGLYAGFRLDTVLAKRGAVRIADAYAAFKERHGAYPASAAELVPDFLGSLPRAKRTIMWGHYRVAGGKVMFVMEPGLLAQAYDIADRKWRVVRAEEMFPSKD